MANQISVNTGSGAGAQQVIVDSNGNITVTVSRSVIGTVANVASANYANFAGNVVNAAQPNITSVGNLTNLNVTNTVTTGNLIVTGNLQVGNLVANSANYANFAGNAFAVAGANVTGAVANATFATTAGSANTANSATVATSANSVTLANVSGAGNIASINLDGSSSNVLYGNGTFAPAAGGNTANANYANFAGNAFSVDGGNVVGAVANATFALDAGNANIANIAYSVDAANVSGLGNIATINLDGNASNFLDGTGNFVPAPGGANANYANFAGDVVNATQSNITQTGNLVSLTINNGVANTINYRYNPNLIAIPTLATNNTAVSVIDSSGISANVGQPGDSFVIKGRPGGASANNNDVISRTVFGARGTGGNILVAGDNFNTIRSAPNVANAFVAGQQSWRVPMTNSNLSNANTSTLALMGWNQTGTLTLTAGAPGSSGVSLLNYGTQNGPIGNTAGATSLQMIRRRGNGDAIVGVEPNDSLGDMIWQAQANATVLGTQSARIRPKVDGGYTAGSNLVPIGFEFQTVGNAGNVNIHSFYANGDVTFANTVTATTFVGNVNGANVVGAVANATFADTANIAYSVDGANVVGAVANATFALDAGNANIANIAYSVDAANVVGLGNIAVINLDGNASNFLDGTGNFVAAPGGANANYANFAGDVINSAQPNITSVGNLTSLTVTGNTQGNSILWSNTITYNGSLAATDKILVQADLAGATAVRNIGIRGGNISNVSASNTTAGGAFLNGGQSLNTDAGNVFIARAGAVFMSGGIANTANGNAFGGASGTQGGAAITQVGAATGGAIQIINGAAISNNGSATSGAVQIGLNIANSINGNATAGAVTLGGMSTNANTGNASGGAINIFGANNRTITSGNATGGTINVISGNARSENGSATSGNIALATGAAIANISGIATVGSINLEVGAPNGVSGNVKGNINIGTNTNANAINIGATGVAVNLNGTVTGNFAVSRIASGTSNVEFTGSNGDLLISTAGITNGVTVSGRTLALYGANTGGGDISKVELINGALNWTLDNTQFSGGTPFGMSRYNSGFLEPLNFYTARGNAASPADVQVGDNAYSERVQVLYNGTTHGIFNGDVGVRSFSPSNAVATTYSISANDDQANSVFQVNFGTANVAGDITATGRIDYLRTFGSFTSNATQTSNGANTTNYVTFNNTEDANGISIVSSTQLTVARTGRYNLQFSAQVEKTDSGSDYIEIWLEKNGNPVANSAGQLTLVGNNAKAIAAWDYNIEAANVNDYFELAWASPDTDVQLIAVDSGNTISGVAIPSIIVDINPVGA